MRMAHGPQGNAPLSRRGVLGVLGAVPLAAAGAAALGKTASAATSGPATPAGPSPAALRPGGAFDQFVSGLAAHDQFSGTVLLAWHGEPVLARSFQQADKARRIPNTASTIFPLASLTKLFTGLAVVQLAAQGKVDFSATIGSYLDGFPAAVANSVTVHELLTHTSGIPEVINTPAYQRQLRTWTTNAAAFNGTLAYVRKQPLAFTPGSRYSYTNTEYFLAGAIVASASGQDLWDYIPRHILSPAGMASTGFFTGQQQLASTRFAHNYGPPQPGGRQDLASQGKGPSGWNGAGGLSSDAPDLLRLALALADGTLLDPAWAELATSGKHPVSPAQHNPDQAPAQSYLIGYGPEERMVAGQRAYGHTGGLALRVPGSSQLGGGSTALTVYPDLGVVAVVLSNYYLAPGIGAFLAQQDRIITQRS